jgi:DNA-directed RNA polymerase specialized sigma24 family protein
MELTISGDDIISETAKWRSYYGRRIGPEIADELIATANLELWRYRAKIRDLARLTCTVMRRCWLQELRRRKRRKVLSYDEARGTSWQLRKTNYPDFLLRKRLITAFIEAKLSSTQFQALRMAVNGETADKNSRFHAIVKIRTSLGKTQLGVK